jgi:hypothetical protein
MEGVGVAARGWGENEGCEKAEEPKVFLLLFLQKKKILFF